MSDGPVVYVTNYAGHNYKTAAMFGELVFVTRGYISFSSLDRVKWAVAEGLRNSREGDYLCLSGSGIICTFAAMIWTHKHRKIKLLVWDMTLNRYQLNESDDETMDTLVEEVLKPHDDSPTSPQHTQAEGSVARGSERRN